MGAATVIRVAPEVGVMARMVPVVSINPVNMDIGYSGLWAGIGAE